MRMAGAIFLLEIGKSVYVESLSGGFARTEEIRFPKCSTNGTMIGNLRHCPISGELLKLRYASDSSDAEWVLESDFRNGLHEVKFPL